MDTIPKFLQGVFSFEGTGLASAALLDAQLVYTVPGDRRAQLIYIRVGNSGADLVTLVLMRNGRPMRYFPVGARADSHVSLAVVEDLEPDTKLEIFAAGVSGAFSTIVLDVGLLEII